MSSDFISARDLLASGVHFGHKVSRWNPKMRPYIFARRNLIHIIDIKETIKGLLKATYFLENLTKKKWLGSLRRNQAPSRECHSKRSIGMWDAIRF